MLSRFDDEDDDEGRVRVDPPGHRLRKERTGHSVWVWYEDPDLLRCHQAPIHAELPS